MSAPNENLDTFKKCIENAPAVREAEEFVRMMLARFAKNCPVHVLVRLGRCVTDIREAELRHEAEQN